MDGSLSRAEVSVDGEIFAANRTTLVTGGAGFLGSHLCERLLDMGGDVVCLDNFQTGRLENVEHLLARSGFRLINHDIVEPLPASIGPVSRIYNLACPASPRHYQADPVRTALACSIGVLNCLNKASADRARFFQASTSEIYGDPDVHPQTETYYGNVNTVGPRSCYDEGKRFAETLITDFCAQQGLTARIARIFNTYGPKMQPDDGRVVSNFIIQALLGRDITIHGSGGQTRSFCFVGDLIDGFIRLMDSETAEGPVNLGNPVETEVGELAEMIRKMVGSRSRVVYRPMPVDDPRRRRPDIERAQALLRWRPRVRLRKGLRETISFFRSEIERGAAGEGLRLTA